MNHCRYWWLILGVVVFLAVVATVSLREIQGRSALHSDLTVIQNRAFRNPAERVVYKVDEVALVPDSPQNVDLVPYEPSSALPVDERHYGDRESVAVVAFDRLTDGWSRRTSNRPTPKENEDYVCKYQALPASARRNCLLRALNLIPDRNFGTLAAIFLDKRTDSESLQAIFEDVVNRPEEVKKPIVEAILKDKTHPCYSDAEWIYEVTGEKVGE